MSKKIVVLSQPGCGKCVMVKKLLKADAVEHDVVNIRKEPEYIERYGISSTPVTLLLDDDGVTELQRIHGFDRDALKALEKQAV